MSTPRQILHVIGELDGYGLTRQLELLVEQQITAGQGVRVVALGAKPQAVRCIQQLAVPCQLLDRRWRRDPIAAWRLAREIRQHPCDVIHLWGNSAVRYARSVRHFLPPRPTLASSRTATHIGSTSLGCISPGIPQPKPPSLSRSQFLAEQCLPEDSILIAVAGPLTRQQQIDEAIWYFELQRTLDERTHLLVFGDGPDRHRLERFSRLAAESSAVRFLGYRNDFRELLPHVDLFWQTAAHCDALPMTLLEAMAAQVPVVANKLPGCRAVIEDGSSGYLVPDKDRAAYVRQSRKLLSDRPHAEQIKAEAAKTIAKRFTVQAMTEGYRKLYDDLICGKLLHV